MGTAEESRYRDLMDKYHDLGFASKVGETLWYVATWCDKWAALVSFSAAAWKCTARDRWIGWSVRHQYDRLKLISNNSRFLILPDYHVANLGSRVLSPCERRISGDWQRVFGRPLLLLETFVDPTFFHSTVYKSANWLCVGKTKRYRRVKQGYTPRCHTPKLVFLKPLHPRARALFSKPVLESTYTVGGPKVWYIRLWW